MGGCALSVGKVTNLWVMSLLACFVCSLARLLLPVESCVYNFRHGLAVVRSVIVWCEQFPFYGIISIVFLFYYYYLLVEGKVNALAHRSSVYVWFYVC